MGTCYNPKAILIFKNMFAEVFLKVKTRNWGGEKESLYLDKVNKKMGYNTSDSKTI